MSHSVLVTGGFGFIGKYTVDILLERGYDITIFDLNPPKNYSSIENVSKVKYIKGDVRNKDNWLIALEGIDSIIHLAALVGIKDSMLQPSLFIETNVVGTSNMYETIINSDDIRDRIKKIILASSAAVYGGCTYKCGKCNIEFSENRSNEQLKNKIWEIKCSNCDSICEPRPISEGNDINLTSIYAMTKYMQENIAFNYSKLLDIPTIALRYFNVYGPGQSLNMYSGVCSIFANQIMNGKQPIIFEDGLQTRDFIFVKDVALINSLILEKIDKTGIFNVCSGIKTKAINIANQLIEILGSSVKPKISEEYRLGDLRHGYGDPTKSQEILGFKPNTDIKAGLSELIVWLKEKNV